MSLRTLAPARWLAKHVGSGSHTCIFDIHHGHSETRKLPTGLTLEYR